MNDRRDTAPVGIGFLHTAAVHEHTFEALVQKRDAGVRTHHLVDPSLLTDVRSHGPGAVTERIAGAVRTLRAEGAGIIVCTCSSIGPVAEDRDAEVPVMRVDRPLVQAAVATGARIAVIAALESTIAPTRELLADEAEAAGVSGEVEVDLRLARGAWELFEVGDLRGYVAAVRAEALAAAGAADVIMLAQASMAPLAEEGRIGGVPVLASPSLAVDAALEWLVQAEPDDR